MEARLRGLIARLRALDVDTSVLEQALGQLRRLGAMAPSRHEVADAQPLQQIFAAPSSSPPAVSSTVMPGPAAGAHDDGARGVPLRPAVSDSGGPDGVPAPGDGGHAPLAAGGASAGGVGTSLLAGGFAAVLVAGLWLGVPRLLRRIELAPATWRRVLLVSLLERPG
jgi:hypothetical protein